MCLGEQHAWLCSSLSILGPGGEPFFPRVPAVVRDDVGRGVVLVVVVVAVVMVRGHEHLVEHLRGVSVISLVVGAVWCAGDEKVLKMKMMGARLGHSHATLRYERGCRWPLRSGRWP